MSVAAKCHCHMCLTIIRASFPNHRQFGDTVPNVAPSPSHPASRPDQKSAGASEIAQLNVRELAERLRERRSSTELSIRQAAEAAGVSFMTWSRVETGAQPDLATFLRLCAWLHVPPQDFFITGARRDTTTPEAVAHHLLTDPRLEQEAASRIAAVVRDMYSALASDPPTPPTVACHLRAAATLRPGVAPRLAALLGEMQARLTDLEAEGSL